MLKWKSSCQPVLYLLGSAMGCKAKGWAAEAEWGEGSGGAVGFSLWCQCGRLKVWQKRPKICITPPILKNLKREPFAPFSSKHIFVKLLIFFFFFPSNDVFFQTHMFGILQEVQKAACSNWRMAALLLWSHLHLNFLHFNLCLAFSHRWLIVSELQTKHFALWLFMNTWWNMDKYEELVNLLSSIRTCNNYVVTKTAVNDLQSTYERNFNYNFLMYFWGRELRCQ